jgi:hypothetical protein
MPGLKHEKHWPNVMRFIDMWRDARPYPLRIVTLNGMWTTQRERDIKAHWEQLGIDTVSWSVITRAEQVDLTVFGKTKHTRNGKHERKRCRFGRDTHWLHVLSDGRATLCCMDYKQEAITGSLHENTIDSLWHSDEFNAMRAKVNGSSPVDNDFICHRCEWHVADTVPVELEGAYAMNNAPTHAAGAAR